jgi:hypothetical protein
MCKIKKAETLLGDVSKALVCQILSFCKPFSSHFKGLEERQVWYDNLPYLGLSLAGERRLLADLVALEAAEKMGNEALSGLARSDALAAAGRNVDYLAEATQVYEAGVKAFERK